MKLRWLDVSVLLLALLGLSSHSASASGAIEVMGAPFTLGSSAPPQTNASTPPTNAFTGFGLGAQLDYYFNGTPWGITAGLLSESNGRLEYVRAKYYFIGHAQFKQMSASEAASAPMVVESKSRGFYAEVGFAPYQVTQTITSTTTVTQNVTTGVGGIAGLGLEQPFIWGSFAGVRADFFSGFGSNTSINIVVFNVLIGIPFSF